MSLTIRQREKSQLKWYHFPIMVFWIVAIGMITIFTFPTIYQGFFETGHLSAFQWGMITTFPMVAMLAVVGWIMTKLFEIKKTKY